MLEEPKNLTETDLPHTLGRSHMNKIIYIGMDVHNNTYSLCGVHSLIGDIVAQTKCATDVNYIHKFIKSVKERMSEENNYDIFMKERGILWQMN